MGSSILEFARDFETFKGRLKKEHSSAYHLLLLNHNWEMLQDRLNNPKYRTFVVEYTSLLLDNLKAANLADLLLPELINLIDVVCNLATAAVSVERAAELQSKTALIIREAAVKSFYAGDIKNGLKLLAEAVETPLPELKPLADDSLCSEIELLRLAQAELSQSSETLYKAVGEIVTEWETALLEISVNSACCLFVELDSGSELGLGRLLKLHGSIKVRTGNIQNDEVTFENQLVSYDDPFTGTIYNSLKAVRAVTGKLSSGNSGQSYYEGRYRVKNCNKELFAGDSIGLASGLIGYTQLLEPLLLRYERFITAEAAFTGGLDENGRILPVNEKTLPQKIERAFFSHIKYLVLPETNLQAARECLAGLQRKYPRRRLHLIGAESLSDTIENHNIVRPEKVCLGQFVVRRVYKYSRATKVQLPLLVSLFLLLTFILVEQFVPPCQKPWGDCNPQYLNIIDSGFEVLNADSVKIWETKYECAIIDSNSAWVIGNIDEDSLNEVSFSPGFPRATPCSLIGVLFVYDDDGSPLFRRECAILNQYPGDSILQNSYRIGSIVIVNNNNDNESYIMTTMPLDYPSRTQIRLWSSTGDSLGWYINAGSIMTNAKHYSSAWDNKLIFLGINNRMGAVCLLVLPDNNFYGVSPPYDSPEYDLSSVKRGNQLHYVIFPKSPLADALGYLYNNTGGIFVKTDGLLEVYVAESYNLYGNSYIDYFLDSNFRVTDVKGEDRFVEFWQSLAKENKLPPLEGWIGYEGKLFNNVMYWTDSGWVTEGQLRDAGL